MLSEEDLVALLAFIRARIDEDEQVARAATEGPWSYDSGKMWLDGEAFETFDGSKGEEFIGYGGPSPFRGCVAATGPANHPQSMADAAFIARHDQARALREVEAKRARVALAEGAFKRPQSVGDYKLEAGVAIGARLLAVAMLRAEAEPYAGHADYQQKWKP